MAEKAAADQVIAAPTYMADIRHYFRPQDVAHMKGNNVQLGTYAGVVKNKYAIYAHTAQPDGDMPPDPDGQWSAAQSQTFRNWITNGCPLGTATAEAAAASLLAAAPGGRVRRNAATLSEDEKTTLATALSGIMARDPDDPNSYYAIAGIHGLPQRWCAHHENRYNPWHRAFLKVFEDALRSVPGCEDVTLPYWDISTPMPDILQHPPFLNYALPRDPNKGVDLPDSSITFPYTTSRYTSDVFNQKLAGYDVLREIARSNHQSLWGSSNHGGYQKFSIQAHDGGHGSIGDTMNDQDVAAFDPVFWFYHCNLDRLWLTWQHLAGATTLHDFITTLDDPTWLTKPVNEMPPFDTTADQTIEFGISYDQLAVASEDVVLENKAGSVEAARSFSIKRSSPVSVRVKDIDRLNIPGSFVVHLLADGEPLTSRFFFQPRSPSTCANCRQQALVNIDFRLDAEELLDRKLSFEIEVPSQPEVGTFPLSQAGNPSINARLLLEDE
jgi:hypothetical protein